MRRNRIWLIAAVLAILLLLTSGLAAAQGSRTTTASKAKKAPSSGKKAVKSSQSTAGKAKGRTSTSRRRRVVYRGPAAPTPQRIREIQQALARSGHYRHQATGKMDAHTVAALSSFQEANGLKRTGKLNAWTLKKLEQFGLPPSSRASTGEAGTEKANP